MQSNTVSVIDLTTLRTILSSGPVSQSSNVRVGTRNQLAYLVEAVAGESRSQGQVAESYRRAVCDYYYYYFLKKKFFFF